MKGVRVLLLFFGLVQAVNASPINHAGANLQKVIENMHVERLWLPDQYVNWETGERIHPTPEELAREKFPLPSHCSDYVAALAKKLNVPMLNAKNSPAGHVMLANHQYDWLHSVEAAKAGWIRIPLAQAQPAANQGKLVIAAMRNEKSDKPGHIAVVVPDDQISDEEILTTGPSISQSGKPSPKVPSGNSVKVRAVDGFYYHLKKLEKGVNKIEFFSYSVKSL